MNYAQLLFPDFSLILCGFLVCRYTRLDEAVWGQVEQLVYWFLFPVLLFYSIIKTPLNMVAAAPLIGAALSLAAISIALSYALPHLPLLGRRIDARAHAGSAQVAFRFNSFVALALAERLGGAAGLQLIAVIIGVCVPLFNTAAVIPMARGSQRGLLPELLRNPLILATAGGLIANVLGFRLADWMVPTVSRIGAASIALGLMSAGAALRLASLAQAKTLGAGVLGIRHVATPVCAVALAHAFGLDALAATMLCVFAGVPTASSCHVLANRLGFDGAQVAGFVTLSTLLAMLSLPLALGLLAAFPR